MGNFRSVDIQVMIREAQLKKLWTDNDNCGLSKNSFLKVYLEDYDAGFGGAKVINWQ